MSRLVAASLAGFAALLAGCNPNPFCLNCNPTGDGGANVDMSGGPPDLVGVVIDLAGADGQSCGDGGAAASESCNGIDDDCNGKVDDVDPAKLEVDPRNCGMCFHECSYPHAAGLCVDSKCQMGVCQPGFYDLDKDPANGCEYACIPNPPAKCANDAECRFGLPCVNGACAKACAVTADCPAGTVCDPDTKLCEGEICDGLDNNCDGRADEGFDFQNDVNNCGACNNACSFPAATGKCVAGVCDVLACLPGFYDINKNGQDGCEYACMDAVATCKMDGDCKGVPCTNGYCGKPCASNVDCAMGTVCDTGATKVCVPLIVKPRAETCNGVDDDCDKVIDNNPTDVGQPCDDYCPPLNACVSNNSCQFRVSNCAGKCCGVCTEGTTICAGGQRVCQMGQGPKLEVCNGLDDNCDGQIDEGFDLQNDPINCGKCGHNCSGTVMNAVAGCTKGACSVLTCKPGFRDLDGNVVNGCEYECPVNPPTVEVCNGKDDDCDGIVDNNLTQPNNFCLQVGPCAGSKPVCGGAAGWACNYKQVNAKIEVDMNGNLAFSEMLCDGFDGNCNGQIDESFTNLGKPCSVGQGACAGKANFVCDPNNAMQVTCPAMADATKAVDEQCNGVDDDCDGLVDESTDGPGQCKDLLGNQRLCKGWHDQAVQVGGVWVYQYEASHPDSTLNVVGTSNTRACSKPSVLPWSPVTLTAAQAACAAVKDSKGASLRLCTATEWQNACNVVPVTPPSPIWSFATNPTIYNNQMGIDNSRVCNGLDQGLGRPWATGAGANCYAKQTNGNLFDMSGNVGEWTSTTVTYNNATYYKVRGGAYNNPGGGMSCTFDFVIQTANYQFNDLGFRCCADNAP